MSTADVVTSVVTVEAAVATLVMRLEVRKFCIGGVLGSGSGYFLTAVRGLAAANAATSGERSAADSVSTDPTGSSTPLASHARPIVSGTTASPYSAPTTDTSVPAVYAKPRLAIEVR